MHCLVGVQCDHITFDITQFYAILMTVEACFPRNNVLEAVMKNTECVVEREPFTSQHTVNVHGPTLEVVVDSSTCGPSFIHIRTDWA